MWSKRFFKSLLVAFLILSVSSSSLFALAFLPSSSGDSERENTGLLSILQSMTSPKYEESLPPSDNFEKVVEDKKTNDDGTVTFTKKELAEIDRILAHAEKSLDDAVEPLHWGLLGTVGYQYPNIIPVGLETYIRNDDFVFSLGVEVDTNCTEGFHQFTELGWDDIRGRVGVGFEL